MGDVPRVEAGLDLREPVRRDRGQQAAARLRVVGEGHELRGDTGRDLERGRDETAIVGGAPRFDAGSGVALG